MENTDKNKVQSKISNSELPTENVSYNPKAKPDNLNPIISKVTDENPATLEKANLKVSGQQDLPNQTLIIEHEKVDMGKDENKKLGTYRSKIPYFKEKPPYEDWDTINHTFNMSRSKTTPTEALERIENQPKSIHENEQKEVIALPKVDLSAKAEEKSQKEIEKIRGWKRIAKLGEKLKIGSKIRDRNTDYYEYSPSLHMPGSDGFTS